MRHPGFLAFPLLLACGLSCNSSASGTIQIITGEETDTFTQTPVPTQILVQAEDSSGNLTTLATSPYPTDTIDLGNQDQDSVAQLVVTGEDADGNKLVYGSSVPLQYGALDGETLPIFVQRVGQNARLPNPPPDTRQFPTLALLSDRFLIIGGGSESDTSLTTQVYDFAQFNLLTPAPTLPIVPASMPLVGTIALLMDAAGDGNYYDFSQDSGTSVTPPDGYSFADVAGGQTIYDDVDGYVFIVGATRTTGAPTAAVLKIDTTDSSNSTYQTGNLSWLTLSVPRLGASACWVDSRGLVVGGGVTSANPTAGGLEIIANGQATGVQLATPPDLSSGSGMVTLDDLQYVLMAGGVTPTGADAGVRYFDLGCSTAANCTPVAWGPALPNQLALTSSTVFAFDQAHAFLVGSEPGSGLTHTFTLVSTGATEVPMKVAHTNASASISPMLSSILVYGGAAGGEIESFTPAPL